MIKWFGQSWGAPVNTDAEHVETPVGGHCMSCDKPIQPGDQGFQLHHGFNGEYRPWHKDCLLDAIGLK